MKVKITNISLEDINRSFEMQGLILELETELNGKKTKFTYQNTFTWAGQPEEGVELKTAHAELAKLFKDTGITCNWTCIPGGTYSETSYLVLLGDKAGDKHALMQDYDAGKLVIPNTTFSKSKAEFLFDTLKKNDAISDSWTKEKFVGKIVDTNKKIEEIAAKIKAKTNVETKAEIKIETKSKRINEQYIDLPLADEKTAAVKKEEKLAHWLAKEESRHARHKTGALFGRSKGQPFLEHVDKPEKSAPTLR